MYKKIVRWDAISAIELHRDALVLISGVVLFSIVLVSVVVVSVVLVSDVVLVPCPGSSSWTSASAPSGT